MIGPHDWPTPNGHTITMFIAAARLDHAVHPENIGPENIGARPAA